MATDRPKTIPEAYKIHEDLTESYRMGWRHGHGCAACNVPSIGDKISRCIDWVGLGDEVTAENIREYHEQLTHAGADNSRDFSPFEFTAHWLNDRPSNFDAREEGDDRPTRESCWEAFEEGTADAIRADLATYSDADYGIGDEEPDQDEDEEDAADFLVKALMALPDPDDKQTDQDEEDDQDEEPEDLTGLDPIALINRLLDAYAAIDDIADMYMGSGDGTAEDRARQRRSNLTYISVQNAVLALMKDRDA
jgi:hypothetical protein